MILLYQKTCHKMANNLMVDYCCERHACIGYQHVNQESQEIMAPFLKYDYWIVTQSILGSKDCVTSPMSVRANVAGAAFRERRN